MRVALYARVSTEEQVDGYSIAAQSRACRDYIASHNWTLVREYIDEGRSARHADLAKRPQFKALMQAAEERAVDVVVVHKLDRFARNLRVLLESLEKLGKANVSFVSITEQVDYSTPSGRLFLTMLGGLAQWFSDQLSDETKKGKRERKAQGLHNGWLPYGLRKGTNGLPEADPATFPRLVELFELAASGLADADVARELNGRGYRTDSRLGANLWRKDTVRRILVNRFYLGELPLIEYPKHRKKGLRMGWKEGKHLSFIDPALFAQAEAVRAENRKTTAARCVSSRGRLYPLTSLLRCWYCEQSGDARRGKMRIAGDRNHVYARCYSRDQGLDCQQKACDVRVFEGQVERWLGRITVTDEMVAAKMTELDKGDRQAGDEKERARLKSQLDRLKSLWLWGDLDERSYLAQRGDLQAKLHAIQPVAIRQRNLTELAYWLRSVRDSYLASTDAERNGILLKLVEKIVVKDDRVEVIVPRPETRALLE